jgi:capsule polysaccharide export protein KpsE/RkpR
VKALSTEPIRQLQAEQDNAAFLRSTIQEQAIDAEVAAAAAEKSELRAEAVTAHARADELRKQLQTMDLQSAAREKVLAARQARIDQLDVDRKAAQAALAAIETRLREARGESGYRGERLRIVDPGIVPERPSSPNVPLNLLGALLLGLVLPVLYLTMAMAYGEQRESAHRDVMEELSKSRSPVRHD